MNKKPLFNCMSCTVCCWGECFESATVILGDNDVNNFPKNSFRNIPYSKFKYLKSGGKYNSNGQARCIFFSGGRGCSMYPKRPECCRVYPLSLIGKNIVIQSECPDSERFIRLFKKKDSRAIAFYNEAKKIFESETEDWKSEMRIESGYTDNLFVFGRIK